MSLRLIKKKVRVGEILYKLHIYEKLDEINRKFFLHLSTDDVKESILSGELVEILDNDSRGKRYMIQGFVSENILLETVCRIEDNIVVISVYLPYYF